MATVILRPTADVSLGHLCSSGSSGYALINEATADDNSTYIKQIISSTSSVSATSRFKVSGSGVGKFKISSIGLTVRLYFLTANDSDTASFSIQLTVNGKTGSSLTGTPNSSYSDFTKTYSPSDFGLTDTVFDGFDAANFVIQVETSGKKKRDKDDDSNIRITQVYITVEYEPVSDTTASGIYLKQNAAYTQANAIWKKTNGVWTKTDKTAIDTTKNYRLIKP